MEAKKKCGKVGSLDRMGTTKKKKKREVAFLKLGGHNAIQYKGPKGKRRWWTGIKQEGSMKGRKYTAITVPSTLL